jgi:hypothetical protein
MRGLLLPPRLKASNLKKYKFPKRFPAHRFRWVSWGLASLRFLNSKVYYGDGILVSVEARDAPVELVLYFAPSRSVSLRVTRYILW